MTEKNHNELELTPVDETPEKEIEIESSGSGSGLLDLGKIADKTSIGEDVLSEILEEEAKTPPITTGIEEKIEIEAAKEKTVPVTQVAVAPKIATVETHPISNAIVLSLGFCSLIYGIIIAVAGSRNFAPGLLMITKNIFWWMVIGAVLLIIFSFLFPHWIFPKLTAYLQNQAKAKKFRVKKV